LLPGHDSLNGEKDDAAHEGRYCEQLDVNVPAGIVMYQASEKAHQPDTGSRCNGWANQVPEVQDWHYSSGV
jgi:hypothetical protein